LYKHVVGHTSGYWADSLVKELIATSEKPDQSNVTDVLNIEILKARYKASKSRVMFFDYDVRTAEHAYIDTNGNHF
jgi:trehalose 6-phosphate synthase/phosphatase